MAAADYFPADRPDAGKTAGDHVDETVYENPDTEAAAFAVTNGVSQAAYANYSAALTAHENRPDIETLADRRAREYGDAYADADFMRANAYDADGTAADAPRPGTVHGDADKSA